MQKSKNAFTMVELVFVIVILGILASVAIPKFAATRDDAEVSKIRADVSAIRSAIVSERQSRLIRGEPFFISSLDAGVAANTDGVALFDTNGSATSRLLSYPIFATVPHSSGKWIKAGNNQYSVNMGGTIIPFTYYPVITVVGAVSHPAGSFDCDPTNNNDCLLLLR